MSTAALKLQPLPIGRLQQLKSTPSEIEPQLTAIIASLADSDEEVRAWAADCLQELESISNQTGHCIEALCSDSNEVIASWVCRLLGKTETPEVFEARLVTALSSSSSLGVQESAASTLASLPSISTLAKPALQQAAGSAHARLKRFAEQALTKTD